MDITVLTNWRFTRLWFAQILSLLAQNLLNFALIIRVYDLAQGTRFANVSVAMLVLSFGIPSIFFAAVAGIYVDHWDRKRVLVVSNVLRAILVTGFLFIHDQLALVLLLTFLISSITQFFTPAEAAAIPALVGKKHLVAANALFVLTFYACFIIGYSGAAPVIKLFGTSSPYYLTAAFFVAASALTSTLPRMLTVGKMRVSLKHMIETTGRELKNNWRTISSDRNLYFPIIQLSLIQALIGIIMALAPALSVALLHVPLEDASHVLVIPTGVGLVIGVALVGRVLKRVAKISLVSTGLVATGSVLTLLGLSGQLYRTVGGEPLANTQFVAIVVGSLLFILGLMNAMISVTSQTMLQENTTDANRGKVFGALNMMINVAATLPVLFAGILADLTSVTKVIASGGLLVLGFAIGQLFYISRSHRRNFFQRIGLLQ